jgi:hypothetical protein
MIGHLAYNSQETVQKDIFEILNEILQLNPLVQREKP